ncbi:MAG TPA: hypothetical protein ENN43_06985, partial [bacterium]|nr:hypothetical protein [bacterium]
PAQTAAGMPAQTAAGMPAQTAAGMPAQTAAGMPAQTVAGAPAQTAAGMPGPPPQIAYNAGKMVINFNEIIPAIKTLTAQGVTPEINSLRTVIESGILAPRSANPGNPPAAVSGAQQNTDAGRAINSISEAFEGLKNAVHKPEHTTIRENAVLIAGRINSLANGAAEALKLAGALPKENPVVLTGAANESAKIPSEALLRQELSAIHTAVTAAAKRAGIPADSREIRITAENYSNFRNEAARLVENLSQFKIFNTQKPADAPIRINTGFDAASAIESLVFLKSRSLPLDNSRFVDMMSKYFSNDMKLSQNIEQFSLLASKLPDPKNAAPEAREVFNAVKETAQNITAMAREMAIRPAESNFKQGIIEQQLKGFIEKSGVSIENNIKDALVKPGADNPVFSGLRDSLKAALVKLTNEIENAAKSALPQDAKENILRVRESANDILTNLNALQFINQKPAAFELIYTQLPVFLNNGFLNGEVQIWFRKGGIKENMAAANPINMVFVLNTTNLGAVKVTMTVVKNQVECTVKTENEKAKQALMRGKNEFVSALKKADFDLRVLSINVGGEGEAAEPPAGSGYIDLGRIDIKA